VKNMLLNDAENPNERAAVTATSLERKLREAKLAISLEKRLTKDQILEGYLNIAYFGDAPTASGPQPSTTSGSPLIGSPSARRR